MKLYIMRVIGCWLGGFVDIACGLVAVATLGFYRPEWDMLFVVAYAKFMLKLRT